MELSTLRRDATKIYQAGLLAADPVEAVRRHVERVGDELIVSGTPYPLSGFDGVFLVGMGKASAAMAQPLVDLLGPKVKGGALNVKYGHSRPLERVRVREAGHPVPDQAGIEGTQAIMSLLEGSGPKDLVLCLISGGGSALSPAPASGLSLEDKQAVTQHLLECGATIHEINIIRKHLSRIKGGRLARLAHPSTLVSLLLSDVIGDDLDTIASGPTVPDRSTFEDCLRTLDRFNLRQAIPSAARDLLEGGAAGRLPDTPKGDDPAFRQTQNVVVGSNALAVQAARDEASRLGYHPLVLSSFVDGETKEVARVHTAIAREILTSGNPLPRPACVISGGETTVTIRGNGLGGRNQEFALAAARGIDGLEDVVVVSVGTDGTDGPTDAAGAVADGLTLSRARTKGMDAETYLERNDSYHFFDPLGDLIRTGPTFTNVMDLRLVMVG